MWGGNEESFYWSVLVALVVPAVACAPRVPRPPPHEIVQRGVLIAARASVSELARGPALVHVYSQSRGGTVYIASARVRDGNGDCPAPEPGLTLAAAPLVPEKRLTVAIREGEVVCLQSQARRPLEILWHAHRVSPASPHFRLRPATLATRP